MWHCICTVNQKHRRKCTHPPTISLCGCSPAHCRCTLSSPTLLQTETRGTVNGIGQSLGALGRTVGPILGSTVFAWSEVNGQSTQLHMHCTTVCVVERGELNYTIAGVSLTFVNAVKELREQTKLFCACKPRDSAQFSSRFFHQLPCVLCTKLLS